VRRSPACYLYQVRPRFLVVMLVTLAALASGTASAKPRARSRDEQAARVRISEALFIEGMRRFMQGGCVAALGAFEQAYAERPGGRHEEVARQWVERCRKEAGNRGKPPAAPVPVDPYSRAMPDPYDDLDSPPGVVYVAGTASPYDDLDGPPLLGYDEPSLE
jgi:hypothetical protein